MRAIHHPGRILGNLWLCIRTRFLSERRWQMAALALIRERYMSSTVISAVQMPGARLPGRPPATPRLEIISGPVSISKVTGWFLERCLPMAVEGRIRARCSLSCAIRAGRITGGRPVVSMPAMRQPQINLAAAWQYRTTIWLWARQRREVLWSEPGTSIPFQGRSEPAGRMGRRNRPDIQ